jgi:S-layer protein
VSLSNIEKLSIRDQHTGGGLSLYNLSGVTGLSTVASNVSTAAVSFTGLQTGTTVAVLGNKVTSVGNVAFNMANNSDTVSLLLDGGVQGAATISNTSTTATTATIASTGAANKVSTISLGGADSFSSLIINATTDLTATLQAADYKSTASLTVTGAGKVDLSSTLGFDGAKIDASANSGGLTIALSSSNIQTVVGSSGADRILGTSLLGSASSIDGGAGIDTMSASLVGAGNGAIFKNFELLDLGSGANSGALDVGQLSNSTITGVVLSGNAAAPTVVLNNLVDTPTGFNVSVISDSFNSNLTLNFNNVTGSNDVLNFDFANVASTQASAGTVTAQGIETVKLNSGGVGSHNALTLVDSSLKSVVITGGLALSLNVSAQNPIGSASQLTSIDGSAATGTLNIAVAAPASGTQSALVIKGGTGNDSFSVATSAASGSLGVEVTTGAGADTIYLASATVRDASSPQFTTITDAHTGDKLQFGGSIIFISAAVPIAGGQTLVQALNTAANTTNVTSWFVYGADSYIVSNNNTAGLDAADVVVKVSGVTDLSGMTGGAGNTLTFA